MEENPPKTDLIEENSSKASSAQIGLEDPSKKNSVNVASKSRKEKRKLKKKMRRKKKRQQYAVERAKLEEDPMWLAQQAEKAKKLEEEEAEERIRHEEAKKKWEEREQEIEKLIQEKRLAEEEKVLSYFPIYIIITTWQRRLPASRFLKTPSFVFSILIFHFDDLIHILLINQSSNILDFDFFYIFVFFFSLTNLLFYG